VRGKYIVLEGGEGVGKTTQARLLVEHLKQANIDAVVMREPGSTPFAQEMRKLILEGPPRSTKANVLAFNAARVEVVQEISQILNSGKWVIADRSYLSTIVYQGHGEGLDIEKVRAVCDFATELQKPDKFIVLDVEPAVAVHRRNERGVTDYFEDMNSQFHDTVREGYKIEAKRMSAPVLDASGTVAEVSELIWEEVRQTINKPSNSKPIEDSELVEKVDGRYQITQAGLDYLDKAVTNTTGNVYAFTGEMSPITVAAAMARLSRRGDDMRVTLLDEFAGKAGKDENLLKRVITAYGDDSVQQLTGMHVVVENASNLMTKKLEWGRLAAYLEQSTRYIYFDQKDKNGNYRYYTPNNFDSTTAQHYTQTMDQIFDRYSEIVHKLTDYVRSNDETPESERDVAWKGATRAQACDAARPLLPVATTATVGIFASGQALEALIMRLRSEELTESQTVGNQLLDEVRKVAPTFFERADKPDRGGATSAYMATKRNNLKKLVEESLPSYSNDYPASTLVDVSHRNEIDIVPYMLYEQSNLSLDEIMKEVNSWSYDKKVAVFNEYIGERLNRRHKPGRALEHIHYTWDIVCDYGIFRDLQRHRIVDGLEWQLLTPRYGYEIPDLVEEAGLSDLFEECFDLSYELYSRLQALGMYEEAQYATLMGHKMRWKITYNARQAFHFHELRSAPQGHPGYRRLINQLHERLSEVHPNIAAAMKFVNKDEDPELTRLAAERYTQFKLQQLQ